MLVIQRSLRKSAPLVESRGRPNQQSRRCLTCVSNGKTPSSEEQRSNTKELAFTKDAGGIYLQGKTILLEHRVPSKKQQPYQINSDPAPYVSKATSHETLSAPRREKFLRRNTSSGDSRKRVPFRSALSDEEHRKTVHHKRKQKVRTPLLMNTMSFPNENLTSLTSKETLQGHMSREDAQATLQRLLSTRTHQSATTSTSKQFRAAGVPSGQQQPQSVTEKSSYLQDSYDYLFQRHLQNLNSVIHQNQQQESHEGSQSTTRHKKTVDIHQNCCGGRACPKDEQVAHDTRLERRDGVKLEGNTLRADEFYSNHSYQCKSDKFFVQQNNGGVLSTCLQKELDRNCQTDSNGETHRPSSDNVAKSKNIMPCDKFNSCVMESQNSRVSLEEENIRSCSSTENGERKRNAGFICINVSNQFQDIHLEEVEPAITKPVITLNHVSESFSGEREEVLVIRSHSRSPSPLLEVPRGADIHQESLRPPLH